MNKLYVVFFVFLIGFQLITAQNSNRKTSDIQINVNTESIEKTIQPQELLVEINKNIQAKPGYMSIGIENIDMGLTLVGAKINNEELWLINSAISSTNEKVIAWDFDEENSRLVIYPFNWNSPYLLDLKIQVNLKNLSSIDNNNNVTVILTSQLSNELVDALPTGNGNDIQIR
jgi:hypothetical protein